MAARIFALSFIGIIVLGNIWFGQSAFGGKVSDWVPMAFVGLMFAAFLSAIGVMIVKVIARFFPSEETSS